MRILSNDWVKLFSFSFFNLATALLPHSSLQQTPLFCDKVTYSFLFSRDAMLLPSSALPPALCFSSLFLSHVLWLHCSLVLALYSQIVYSSQVHWIFVLLTAACKSSQERCTFPLFFPRLWSLITWGKWSPCVWGKWSSCIWAGKIEFIWFSLGCNTSLNVAHLTSDSLLHDITQFLKVL